MKGVVTPGVKPNTHQLAEERELPEREHTRFRALAARANYLAAARPDLMFAAKEVCRLMAKPTDVAMASLKRLGRYLKARPRLVFRMPFQIASTWTSTQTLTGRAVPGHASQRSAAASCSAHTSLSSGPPLRPRWR